MYYDLVTAPECEPVTLLEAKDHLLIDNSDSTFDNYIDLLTKAARKYIEARTGYVCVLSTWAMYLDEWPYADLIYINKKPVASVTKIEYLPPDGEAYVELSTSSYTAVVKHNPPVVKLKEMPDLEDVPNAVKITFTAGHDPESDTDIIPEYLTQAIKILLRQMFENRTEEVTGTIVSEIKKGFEYLLQMAEQPNV